METTKTNHMAEVAEMLGVKMDEDFMIQHRTQRIDIKGTYRVTASGLYMKRFDYEWTQAHHLLSGLLTGVYKAVKL